MECGTFIEFPFCRPDNSKWAFSGRKAPARWTETKLERLQKLYRVYILCRPSFRNKQLAQVPSTDFVVSCALYPWILSPPFCWVLASPNSHPPPSRQTASCPGCCQGASFHSDTQTSQGIISHSRLAYFCFLFFFYFCYIQQCSWPTPGGLWGHMGCWG